MDQNTSTAIVLKSIPFKDFDRIVHLFTEKEGLVSAYLKGASKPSHQLHGLITPFSYISVTYTKGRGEMVRVMDGESLKIETSLRSSLSALKASVKCTETILKTQLPHRTNEKAFRILKSFLSRLGKSPSPEVCAMSFQLKIMHLEGLFNFANACDRCHTSISKASIFLSYKESFCKACSHEHMLELSLDEQIQLSFLTRVLSWDKLYEFPFLPDLQEKVERIFGEVVLEKEYAREGI